MVDPYQRAADFLFGRIDYERTPTVPFQLKLERMHRLLELFGRPHESLPVVHIAGSKGKGSTATMISSILTHCGYRTGLYTSPHLESVEERIRLQGEPCSRDELIALVEQVRPVVAQMDNEAGSTHRHIGRPTYFEIVTAMAMKCFADRELDVAILEVGLGGRLDSTNVCRPLVTVITSISLDHTRQLGNTLAAIAGEKSGIIKPAVPVVSGVIEAESRNVITETAKQHGCDIWQAGRDFHVTYRSSESREKRRGELTGAFDFESKHAALEGNWQAIQLQMAGRHQAANGALALTTTLLLRQQGWRIADDDIRAGLRAAICPGRIQVVGRQPLTILDTAHNGASIRATLDVLDEHAPGQPRTVIFAATRGKNARRLLELLLPNCQKLILTCYEKNPRSHSPEQLMKLAAGIGSVEHARIADTPSQAWELAKSQTGRDEMICVTGSFFLAAEMLPLLRANRPALRHQVVP